MLLRLLLVSAAQAAAFALFRSICRWCVPGADGLYIEAHDLGGTGGAPGLTPGELEELLPLRVIPGGDVPPLFVPASECPICLEGYGVGDLFRVVPVCGHGFHAPCIDRWLAWTATCPLCRRVID